MKKRIKTRLLGLFISIMILIPNLSMLNVPVLAQAAQMPRNSCMYYIEHVKSGRVLDVTDNSFQNGTQLQIWDFTPQNHNQVFVFYQSGDCWYIKALHSKMAIEVRNSSTANYTEVSQWSYVGIACQQWYIIDNGDNTVSFKNKNSGLLMDVFNGYTSNGSKIVQYEKNGSDAQRFRLLPVRESDILNATWTRNLQSKDMEWEKNSFWDEMYPVHNSTKYRSPQGYHPVVNKEYLTDITFYDQGTAMWMISEQLGEKLEKEKGGWHNFVEAMAGDTSEEAINYAVKKITNSALEEIPYLGIIISLASFVDNVMTNKEQVQYWNSFRQTACPSATQNNGVIVEKYVSFRRMYALGGDYYSLVYSYKFKPWYADGIKKYIPSDYSGQWMYSFKDSYTITTTSQVNPPISSGSNNTITFNNNYESYPLGSYAVDVLSSSSLNVRKGPGTGYKCIGSLYRNNQVNVTEISNGCWGKIQYNGQTGWICLVYAKHLGSSYSSPPDTTTPITTEPAVPVITWSTDRVGVYTLAKNSLNLRKKAETNSPTVAKLTTGDIVEVKETAILPDGNLWAHASFNGVDGYCIMKEGNEYLLTKKISPEKPSVNVNPGSSFVETTFTWKNCKNGKTYNIRIYDSAGKLIDSQTGMQTTSYKKGLLAGSYSVDVTAVYSSEYYTTSNRVAFTVQKTIPEKPVVKVNPGNDRSITYISWNKCKDADCYDMIIYTANGKEYKKLQNTTETSFKDNLSDIADYYVIVTSKNNTDKTEARSDRKDFKVVSAVPSKPTLNVLPGNNHTETSFSWNVCDNTDLYELEVINKDNGQTVISESLTDTHFETILSTAGNYTAQVTAVYTKGNTRTPSEKVDFYVESVDVTEFDVSVAGLTDSVVYLEWTESQHATQYDIYRYENGGFTLVGTTSEQYFTDTGLYIGTAYSYYVTSSNQWTSIDSNQVVDAETLILTINGSGTEESPYLVSDADDLLEVSFLISNPTTSKMFANCYYQQTADIDLENIAFTPIGTLSTPFTGYYNGNYHVLSGLNISADYAYSGLFGCCSDADIRNIVVRGSVSSSDSMVGGIAGEIGNSSVIENCAFYGDVTGAESIGGIVGNIQNGGSVIRCYHMGNVIGSVKAGGVAGSITNTISAETAFVSCYHAGGNVSGQQNGGITGVETISDASSNLLTYQGCFYLQGSASSEAGGRDDKGILSASDTVFRNLADSLGDPFTSGDANNSYYPVFRWEIDTYQFKGEGTVSSPYLIENGDELRLLSQYASDPYLAVRYVNANYLQTTDIDLGGVVFTPIGNTAFPFSGSYNGCYHTISGLNAEGDNAGLFGCVESIKIKNLIINGSVTATDNAGGFVGLSTQKAELVQCAFNGSVSGKTSGGLIGKCQISGSITNSYQTGSVSGTISGGLLGSFESNGANASDSFILSASYHGNGTVGSGAIGYSDGEANSLRTENVYYLMGSASNAGYAKAASDAVLKNLAVTLDAPFVNSKINNGYPVFEWQVSRYEFEGNGTEASPYIIASADDLIAMQRYVNDPSYNAIYGSAHYSQTQDIDLGDIEWDAIGINEICPFTGVYEGNYCTIFGLNAYGDTYSGLFGQVGATTGARNAGVYDLIIKYGTSCSATGVTGGTAAVLMNGATVDQCSVIGDLSGGKGVGGIIGIVRRSASITNSFHNGDLTGISMVGGIVGYIESGTARIENCYHTGGVVLADEHSGAIVGFAKGTPSITNCYYLSGSNSGAINEQTITGTRAVTPSVLQNLSTTLGKAYMDNYTVYNSGYPVFAKQFEIDTLGVMGDVNADGKCSIADVVMLQKWLLCSGKLTDWQSADMNSDGKINAVDLTLLKRMLIER